MRADRLLAIVLLIQRHGRLSARALADRLEVSPRTILRDMDALSAAGVPVYAERGAAGGWSLAGSYRLEPPLLSDEEIQSLLLSGPARPLRDLGLAGASGTAVVKLLAALPEMSRRAAEQARERILIDTASWRRSAEPAPALPAIHEALWRDRRIELVYRRDHDTVTRVVDPLGLVMKGDRWYLVAATDGEPRTYRVSRVARATALPEPVTRPPRFDLAVYWERSTDEFIANLPRFPLVARVAPSAVHRLSFPGSYARVESLGEPDHDGWRTVHLVLETEDEAVAYALGFGAALRVIEPETVRERVVAGARAVLAAYGRGE
ncbi:MAG: transcriptional regulator [Dehalococcoidia bacterium]|nr:MAG: transcriptional regulator [Dehalococcoidia bacterium]